MAGLIDTSNRCSIELRQGIAATTSPPYHQPTQQLVPTETTTRWTALCAVRCSVLAARAVSGGVSNPPGLSRQPPRGRPGGLLTPRCRCCDHSPNVRAICAPFARALSREYTLQITRGSHCTFNTHLRKYSRCFGHHIVSVELCSAPSRLFASLRPAARACGP